MQRAALYARVSTELQEKEQTIQSQLAVITGYAERHGFRHSTALTYTDDGYSGTWLDRPGLDELRDHAREGRFEVVIVLCPDRLARRYAYQVLLLEELKRAGVAIHFCERPINDSPDDQLLLQIQGALAVDNTQGEERVDGHERAAHAALRVVRRARVLQLCDAAIRGAGARRRGDAQATMRQGETAADGMDRGPRAASHRRRAVQPGARTHQGEQALLEASAQARQSVSAQGTAEVRTVRLRVHRHDADRVSQARRPTRAQLLRLRHAFDTPAGGIHDAMQGRTPSRRRRGRGRLDDGP